VPGNLAASNITATSVSLNWAAATDNVAVTGYRVYRDGILLFASASLNFGDSGLQAATTYLYSVTAQDAGGNESLASEITVTTPAAPVTTVPQATSGGSAGAWLLMLLGGTYVCRKRRRQRQG
jgi:chitodextrinase